MINSNDPIVSVVMPTYNRKKTIGRAIESALAQTYKNIEIIVVDDGSTDGTKEVVAAYLKNPAVRYIYEENKGCVVARNEGIERARGKYIAILDDDDFWCDKDKIKKQVDFLEKNRDYILVGGGAIKIDSRGKEVAKYLLPEKDEDIRKKILTYNAIAHVTILFKKDAWQKIGGYDKYFDGLEDWELINRIGAIGKIYNIQEIFAVYSSHNKENPSYLNKKRSRFKRLGLSIEIIKKYKKYYPGYKKAIIYCYISYIYSFLPFNQKLWPIIFKIRNTF